jgi:hypothetical protein
MPRSTNGSAMRTGSEGAGTGALVTERRVAVVDGLLRAAGIPPPDARGRAVTIVSAVIGYQQLVSSGWEPASDSRALVDTLFAIATAPVSE